MNKLFLEDEELAFYIKKGVDALDKHGYIKIGEYLEILGDNKQLRKIEMVRKHWYSLFKRKERVTVVADKSKYMVLSNKHIDVIYDAEIDTFSFKIKWIYAKQDFNDTIHCQKDHTKSDNFDFATARMLNRVANKMYHKQLNPSLN